MQQIARNLTDAEEGFLGGKRYLLMDRDTKFTEAFRIALEGERIRTVRLPRRSPNLTPHIERFMRSVKQEALERLILFGQGMLRSAVRQYLLHYHAERNHQGIGNTIIAPDAELGQAGGEAACRKRLGGLLRYDYRRKAA